MMKFSLDKWGCCCSALLLSELLGMDIFLSISNDGGSCYLLGFAMNSNFISSLSHTSYHLSLSFFIVQTKQSKLRIAGLDHQKVCRNFLWIQCTFEYTSKKLIHSSILSHNCSLLLLHNTTSDYILDLGNKQGKKLSESLQ